MLYEVITFTRDLSQTIPGSEDSGITIIGAIILIVIGAGAFWYWRRKNNPDEME